MKVPFQELGRAALMLPNFDEPRCFVFGSDDAVRRVYGLNSLSPSLDFSQSVVIAVHRGQARSGGHDIKIEGVESDGGQVAVHVRRIDPPPGAFVTMALTYPRTLVRVKRDDLGGTGPWTFGFFDEKGHLLATVHEQV